jgi:hypothetical protein
MYIVMELQINADGKLGNLVWVYDTLQEAESKYHAVLSAAAISSVPIHSAVIMDERGNVLMNTSYDHPTEAV